MAGLFCGPAQGRARFLRPSGHHDPEDQAYPEDEADDTDRVFDHFPAHKSAGGAG